MNKIEQYKTKTTEESLEALSNEDITLVQEPLHRILVVAPKDESRDRLSNLLERENSTVQEFENTTAALDYLESLVQPEEIQLINMIIVDWSLSDSVLKKLVRHLQQAPFSNIPVIALTQSPCIEINEAMMFLKHTAVVQKPIKTNDMMAILHKYLLQPTSISPKQCKELEYYNLLESNSLLELAVKNHNNSQSSKSQTISQTDLLN